MMKKECLTSAGAPPALGPYSHGVCAGELLFVSGQGPFAPDGSGKIDGDFEAQTVATLDNLKTLLEDCGSGLEHVVKTTVFLTDMKRFKQFNEIYARYFRNDPPARSCVQAAALPGGIEVEVEAIALRQ